MLSGSQKDNREDGAKQIIEVLRAKSGRFLGFGYVRAQVQKKFDVNTTFIKMALQELSKKDVVLIKGDTYKLVEQDKEKTDKIIAEIFGGVDEVPERVRKYYEKFGFEALVSSVSKWIDIDGNMVEDFDKEALWTGRYIDFLHEARRYMAWFDAEQAKAKKRLADIKKQQNSKS